MKKVNRVTVFCVQCNAAITVRITEAERKKFCSRQCGGAYGGIKHGMSYSGTYASWAGMLQRCKNPKAPKYARYGAAGISVSPEWTDFARFFADMGERPSGTTLDRIDGSTGYCKENCRWAAPKEQQRNIKSNRLVTFAGETMCVSAWAEKTGINKSVLFYRIKAGWPPERALSSKPGHEDRSLRRQRA